MEERIQRFKEIQDYYWTVMESQVNNINDPLVQEMLVEKFGEEIPVNTFSDILQGNFNINIEDAIDELKTSGIHSREYVALKLVLEDDTPEVFFCVSCGKYYSVADAEQFEYDGNTYCGDCRDREFYTCCICSEYVHQDDVIIDEDGDYYCGECADETLYRCSECGDYFTEWGIIRDSSNNFMCRNCFEHSYYICADCGSFTHSEDTYHNNGLCYCGDCYDSHCVIHEYDYKPSPHFYGQGKKYLGVELEVDRGGEDNYNAEQVLDVIGNEYAYCKHDGSLDDGFEVVSHPATLDFHMREIDWEGALQELKDLDYVSHDAGTCGIHVHLNREGFGDTEEEQDLGIAKVLYFFERHWSKIVKFSRRTYSQLDRWAARYLDDDPTRPEDVLDYAKDDMSRYRCVNLCNYSTVELRVFRGSLVYETFTATLQFADLMYEVAELSLEEVMDLTWDDFKEMGSKYEEFTSYLERRRL